MTARPTNSGVIVALLPSKEYVETRPTISDHHLTVAYLGRYDHPDINDKAIKTFWDMLGKLWDLKLKAKLTGESVFATPDGWAHVDLVDAPFLPDFRAIVQETLDVTGLPLSRDHGFMPHITRRYVQNPEPLQVIHREQKLKFSLDRVVLWNGDDRLERPLK